MENDSFNSAILCLWTIYFRNQHIHDSDSINRKSDVEMNF